MAVVAPSDLVSDEVASSLGRPAIGGLIGGALGGSQLGGLGGPPLGGVLGDLPPDAAGEGNVPPSGEVSSSLSPSRASGDTLKRAIVLVVAGVSVFLGLLLIVSTIKDSTFGQNGSPVSPIDGLTIFAVFFVAAFAIERLLEPLSALLISKQDVSDDPSTSMNAAKEATLSFYNALAMQSNAAVQLATARSSTSFYPGPQYAPTGFGQMLGSPGSPDFQGSPGSLTPERQQELQDEWNAKAAEAAEAAKRKAEQALQVATEKLRDAQEDAQIKLAKAAAAVAAYEDRDYIRTVIFWAVATIVAMLGSASLHLYFLHSVGISSASRWLEVLATGLIIGAGTKPLHDLTTALSARKEQA
jgi:ElaB/YqjD/DUF883 family membrane-anchored ribosome-binding protein